MCKRLTLGVWQEDFDGTNFVHLLGDAGNPVKEVFDPCIAEYRGRDGVVESRLYEDENWNQEFYKVPVYALIDTRGFFSPDFEDLSFERGPAYEPDGTLTPCETESIIWEGWGAHGYRNPRWGVDCDGDGEITAPMVEKGSVEVEENATPDKILRAVARVIGAYPRDLEDLDDWDE